MKLPPTITALRTIGLSGESTPELGLRLGAGDVAIWRTTLDDQPPAVVAAMRTLLSADELDRASRFYFERDRERYIVARGVLRTLLGQYLGRPPASLQFVYGEHGKPALAREGALPPVYFNLGHSESLALIAITRVGEVGIDVEKIRDLPDWEGVAEAAFSPRELARLKACPPERRRDEFFRAWTRQEAVLKALGTGLGAAQIPEDVAFHVHPLNPGDGYAGALAAAPGANCNGVIHGWKAESRPSPQCFLRNGSRSATVSIPQQPLS
jgi:4'-phosphopantetheinyl transferase